MAFLLLEETQKQIVNEYLPEKNHLNRMAVFFQNFSDATRLKIISCLSLGNMCVNDMSQILNINQTTLSHQLKLLKDQNIVDYVRNGKILTYCLKSKRINDFLLGAVNYAKATNCI